MERGGKTNERAVGLMFISVINTVTSYQCKIRTITF